MQSFTWPDGLPVVHAFPPFTTVQNYFYAWRDGGLLCTISNSLVMAAQERWVAKPVPGWRTAASLPTSSLIRSRSMRDGSRLSSALKLTYPSLSPSLDLC